MPDKPKTLHRAPAPPPDPTVPPVANPNIDLSFAEAVGVSSVELQTMMIATVAVMRQYRLHSQHIEALATLANGDTKRAVIYGDVYRTILQTRQVVGIAMQETAYRKAVERHMTWEEIDADARRDMDALSSPEREIAKYIWDELRDHLRTELGKLLDPASEESHLLAQAQALDHMIDRLRRAAEAPDPLSDGQKNEKEG